MPLSYKMDKHATLGQTRHRTDLDSEKGQFQTEAGLVYSATPESKHYQLTRYYELSRGGTYNTVSVTSRNEAESE